MTFHQGRILIVLSRNLLGLALYVSLLRLLAIGQAKGKYYYFYLLLLFYYQSYLNNHNSFFTFMRS